MRRTLLVFLTAAAFAAAADLRVVAGDQLQKELSEYLLGEARKHWNARREKISALRTQEQVAERRQYVQNWLTQALGPFPEKTPLNARITGSFSRDGYRVEHLVFESMPNFYVTANVYVPLNAKPPFPAVVGTAGHSVTGKAIATYQYAWIGMVKRGFLVLAFDPPGQGERSEYFDRETGKSFVPLGTRQHDMAGTQCLLTGTTFARYEIWDAIRAVDYLLTRSDVDPKRIAVAGNSGGGTQSAYLGVVEPRLAVGVISCYMTRWEELWQGPGPQDAEQDFPGFIAAGLDFGDFMIGMAPKPVTMLTGIRDYFPIHGARETYAEVKRVFGILGAEDRAGYFEYDDEHGWHKPRREATYRWLEKWLQGREVDGAEPEIAPEPEENLNATKTGQVATSLGGETVHSINRSLAEKQFASRKALRLSPAQLRQSVSKAIHLRPRSGVPSVTEVSSQQEADGSRVLKLLIQTEPNLRVPGVLTLPAGGRKFAAAIVIDQGGKAEAADRVAELVKGGTAVLAIDPRGWGEIAPAKGASGYSPDWQLAQRALLLGRPLIGMQVFDVLRAFDYLRTRKEIEASKISIIGAGNGGVVALYAAALEPRIASADLHDAVASYMAVVRSRTHRDMIGIVVPGVLSEFDLPDLAKAIAPRPLRIHSPRDPLGNALDESVASAEYGPATAYYESRGRKQQFQLQVAGR